MKLEALKNNHPYSINKLDINTIQCGLAIHNIL